MDKIDSVLSSIARLSKNRVHIIQIDRYVVDVGDYQNILSVDEKKRAAKINAKSRRHQFIVSRLVLRKILSLFFNKKPYQICIDVNQDNKPIVNELSDAGIVQFNIAHSERYILIGLTLNHHIGIDLEKINYDIDYMSLADRFFHQIEAKALAENKQYDTFYRFWVKKESFTKAIGAGIAFGLSKFIVSLNDGLTKIISHKPMLSPDNWYCTELEISDGYQAALTINHHAARLIYFKID